jgi:hypothetical protein
MELNGNISTYLVLTFESLDHTMGVFQTHANWKKPQICPFWKTPNFHPTCQEIE